MESTILHKQPKILHLITSLDIGGTELSLIRTTSYLKQDFRQLVVCLLPLGPVAEELDKLGIETISLKVRGWSSAWRSLQLIPIIRRFHPDVLTSYLIHASLLGRFFGRICGVDTIIYSVRGWFRKGKYFPWLALDRATSFLVDKYLFNSNAVFDFYQKYFHLPRHKCEIIPNSVDTKKYSNRHSSVKIKSKFGLEHNSCVVGFVGKFRPEKDIPTLISAFAQLKIDNSTTKPVYLLLVGDGPELPKIKQQVASLNISSSVKFTGLRRDISKILPAIDIFVLPSIYEGMSNSLLEAMSAGCAVIASDIPENRELITSSDNGQLFPANEALALKKCIQHLVSQPQALLRQSRSNKLLTRGKYTLDLESSRVRKFYSSILFHHR